MLVLQVAGGPDLTMSSLPGYLSWYPPMASELTNRFRSGLEYVVWLTEWLYQNYHYYDSFSDAKLRDWPLMSSPLGPMVILLFYLVFVYHGQRHLHQPPSQLHPNLALKSSKIRSIDWNILARPFHSNCLLFVYNLFMSLLNGWIFYELLTCGLERKYNFLCQLVYIGTDNQFESRIARAMWWYFASKGIELLDTVFIVLRAKRNQLTFLHTYHHSTMFAVWWVGAKFVPGGSALTGALVNCLVHVLMYGYYALSALGPAVRPYLWWKKYLTIIQLVQFTAGVSLGLNSIFSGCPFTRWMQYVFVAYAFSFLILFGKFYRTTYATHVGGNTEIVDSYGGQRTFLMNSSDDYSSQQQLRDQAIKQMLLAAAAGNLPKPTHGFDSQWTHSSSASRSRHGTRQGRPMSSNLLKSHRRRKAAAAAAASSAASTTSSVA